MISPFMLYIWQILDGVCIFCVIGTIICFIVSLLLVFFFLDMEAKPKMFFIPIGLFLLSFIFSLAAVLIPSTKQASIIFGVPYLISEAKEMQLDRIPPKLIEYLDAYLDKETKNLKK